LQNKLTESMPELVIPAATNAGLPASSLEALFAGISSGSFANVPGINDRVIAAVSAALTTAYERSFQLVFYTTIPFSVLLILSAAFVPNMEKFLGMTVAKRLQGGKIKAGETGIKSEKPAEV
jgi:hypothetical protein